ncbi:putative DNA binding domain-containing protein [bacterium]|nr:putative DNA binding domain-containing protein [bacterium]
MKFRGESKNIEHKQEIPAKHEKLLKDIIAFSNSSGGRIVVGIADKTGEVVGIGNQNPFKLSDAISDMIFDACEPMIETDIYPGTVKDKTVLYIDVAPGKFRPYYLKSLGKSASTYVRINGISVPASERKIMELEMEGKRISYDGLPEIGLVYTEKDARKLCRNMRAQALKHCISSEQKSEVKEMTTQKLEDLGILHREGKRMIPTHAFVLLSDNKNRNAIIQCARFKGDTRSIFIDRREFDGPIYEQVEEAYKFVLKHINLGADIVGIHTVDVYELPVWSIREMIANAVVHRSYLAESCVQVSVYDNRIEVYSPGTLYDGIDVEQAVSGTSRCRNSAIAAAFQYMRIIDKWGTGIPRIIGECKEYGLPEPKFEEFGDGVKATLFRKTSDKNERQKTSDNKKQAIKTSDKKQATKTQTHINSIIEFLSKTGETSAAAIAELIGLSAQRTRAVLSQMADVETTGSNKNRKYKLKKQAINPTDKES